MSNGRIVFRYEDRFGSGRLCVVFGIRRHGIDSGRDHRKPDPEGAAAPRRAVYPEAAARLIDDPRRGGEAQTNPLSLGFGGKERLKHPSADFIGHSGSGIPDHDLQFRAGVGRHFGRHRTGGQGQFPTIRHGVSSVDHEVDQDLFELHGIHLDVAGVGGEVGPDPDVFSYQPSEADPACPG